MLVKGIVVSLIICFINTNGEDEMDADNMDPKKLWKPTNGISREKFFRCRGMECDSWKKRQLKLLYLNYISKHQNNEETKDTEIERPGIISSDALELANLEEDSCVHLTEKQIDQMIESMQRNSTRVRRKLYDQVYTDALWETPIVWKFDGAHNEEERKLIRDAFTEWESQTCLSFIEIDTNTPYEDNHLLLTRSDDGCYAYMGRVEQLNPQIVNLGSGCFFAFGVSLHEIGHSLGLFHEHQRSDRDNYININLENLNVFQAQFSQYETVNLAPYDFTSVMHYAPKSFSFNNKPIISPQDHLYLHNMGQRVGLSFADAKTINLSPYCKMECDESSLEQPCQRKGYQDPFDCSNCRCPPGFSGKFCESIAPSENEKCGGIIHLKDAAALKSPGYPFTHYKNFIECNWYVKSPPNTIIQLAFEGQFGVYKFDPTDSCYHWVEVKYKDNLETPGPRFCGSTPPQVKLRSSKNEMLILLRSNYYISQTTARQGFSAVVSVVYKKTEITRRKKKFKCRIYENSGRKYCYRYACKVIEWSNERQCYKFWCIFKLGTKEVRCYKRKVTLKQKSTLGTFKTKSLKINTSEPPKISITTNKNMVCIGPVGKRFCYMKNMKNKIQTNS